MRKLRLTGLCEHPFEIKKQSDKPVKSKHQKRPKDN